jgi:hypothetical protein
MLNIEVRPPLYSVMSQFWQSQTTRFFDSSPFSSLTRIRPKNLSGANKIFLSIFSFVDLRPVLLKYKNKFATIFYNYFYIFIILLCLHLFYPSQRFVTFVSKMSLETFVFSSYLDPQLHISLSRCTADTKGRYSFFMNRKNFLSGHLTAIIVSFASIWVISFL